MPLTTSLKVYLNALLTLTADLSVPQDNLDFSFEADLPDGTGTGQASFLWHDKRSITSGGNESLDLAGGLTNVVGQVLTYTRLKLLAVRSASTNSGTFLIGPAATNGMLTPWQVAADRVRVHPGGLFLLTYPSVGYVVTAATGDLINILNTSGTSSVYDIVIIGS